MSHYYCDTSAVVKNYCKETGSAWIASLLSASYTDFFYIGSVTMAEFGSAVALKNRLGSLSSTEQQKALNLFLADCTNLFQLVEPSLSIIEEAVKLTQKHNLRGYDAIQLALALYVKNILESRGITDFILITADNNLIAAATGEGLTVENPNNHP